MPLSSLDLANFVGFSLFTCALVITSHLKKYRRGPQKAIIEELIVYPIKGCRGFSCSAALLTSRGLQHDRSFMIVRADSGKFISQRSHPRMCLIATEIQDEELIISVYNSDFRGDDMTCVGNSPKVEGNVNGFETNDRTNLKLKPIRIPLYAADSSIDLKSISVSVWGTDCMAYDCGDEAAQWFTQFLEGNGVDTPSLRLVRMPPPHVFRRAAEMSGTVSFADQYPLLLTSQVSWLRHSCNLR